MARTEITRGQALGRRGDLLDLIYRNLNSADTRAQAYPEKQPPGLAETRMALKLLADVVDRELGTR